MKLWHLFFSKNEKVFPDEKIYLKVENVARTKFTIGMEFVHLSDFFQRHIELKLRKLKYDGLYKTLNIELSNEFKISHDPEGICIAIPFDIKRYNELYPKPNPYPMTYDFNKYINPVTNVDEFNQFIYKTTLDALNFAEQQKEKLPFDFLKTELDLFAKNNFKREWYYQKKTFKEHDISASLLCKQNCNEFIMELIITRKRKEIFREKIGKANPNYLTYRMLYGDLKVWENTLMVVKNNHDYLSIEEQAENTIFKLDLTNLNIT